MKKALKISMIMLLAVLAGVFLVTSCEGPTGPQGAAGWPGGAGGNGAAGLPGGYYEYDTSITDVELAALYEKADNVILVGSASPVTIFGKVPEGKFLYVASKDVRILAGQELELKGTLEITKEGTLWAAAYNDAGGPATDSGTLKIDGGSITGYGKIYLPFIQDEDDSPGVTLFGGVDYLSDAIADDVVKVAYSTFSYDGGSNGAANTWSLVDVGEIADIFNASPDLTNELTVENITGIVTEAIENAGDTLTLLGTLNTIGSDTHDPKFEPVGTVIVKGTLATTSVVDITPYLGGKIIIPKGNTLVLTNATDKITSGGTRGVVQNSGTITTEVGTGALLQPLLKLPGTDDGEPGAIRSTVAVNLGTVTVDLSPQNLEIAGVTTVGTIGNATDPIFNGSGTVTVSNTGQLVLGATDITSGAHPLGVSVYTNDNGVVTTTTTAEAVLKLLIDGDTVKAGVITTPVLPDYPDGGAPGTANISGGTVAALTGGLTVHEDVSLITGSTFATGDHPVTVDGSATFSAASFAGLVNSSVTVNGSATFSVVAFANLAAGSVTVNGSATFTAATFPALTTGSITISGADNSPATATFVVALNKAAKVNVGSYGYASLTGPVTSSLAVSTGGWADITGNLAPDAASTLGITGGTVEVTGNVDLSALTGATTIGGSLRFGGNLTVSTGQGLAISGKLIVPSTTFTGAGTGLITTSGGSIQIDGKDYSFTIPGAGVAGTGIVAVLADLDGDLTKLTNTVNVAKTFGEIPSIAVYGIGAKTITATTAQSIATGADGTGSDIAGLDADTTVSGGSVSSHRYSKTDVTSFYTGFNNTSKKLEVTDASWNTGGTVVKQGIITVKDLKLTNNGVEVIVPDFNIGIGTKQL